MSMAAITGAESLCDNDTYIAVMGATGAGKSTFISKCTEEPVAIGGSLESCTREMKAFTVQYDKNTTVQLIDTPGFDDDSGDDTSVLKEIGAYLKLMHSEEKKLHGLIYCHRITDNRMGGSAKRNLFTFQKLVGTDALKNVILTTTMWERLASPEEGQRRIKELEERDDYWGCMVQRNSTTYQHYNTRESAMALIAKIVQNFQEAPVELLMQKQMIDQNIALLQTDAGQVVDGGLSLEREKMIKRIEDAEADLRNARDTHNQEMFAQAEARRSAAQEKLAKTEQQQEDLKISIQQMYEEKIAQMEMERERAERERDSFLAQLKEKDEETATVAAKHANEMSDLKSQFQKLHKRRTRPHPVPSNLGKWSTSMTLFGDLYWFVGKANDFGTILPDIPKPRRPDSSVNGNRCVVFGDENCWWIHYQLSSENWESRQYSTFSQQFATIYPDAYEFLRDNCKVQEPTCISLSTHGHYFVSTATEKKFSLPDAVVKRAGSMDDVHSLWLGYNNAYVIQRVSQSDAGATIWSSDCDLRGRLPEAEDAIRRSSMRILTLTLNPTDGSQYAIVWENGAAMYSKDAEVRFDQADWEDWCTVNFGTCWSNEGNIGEPSKPTTKELILFDRTKATRWWAPWKKLDKVRVQLFGSDGKHYATGEKIVRR